MTIRRFLTSIVLGVIASWAAMYAAATLYQSVLYLMYGISTGSALVHIAITGACITYFMLNLGD
jgi:hypothetical protein